MERAKKCLCQKKTSFLTSKDKDLWLPPKSYDLNGDPYQVNKMSSFLLTWPKKWKQEIKWILMSFREEIQGSKFQANIVFWDNFSTRKLQKICQWPKNKFLAKTFHLYIPYEETLQTRLYISEIIQRVIWGWRQVFKYLKIGKNKQIYFKILQISAWNKSNKQGRRIYKY